jgi:hypothetical protein
VLLAGEAHHHAVLPEVTVRPQPHRERCKAKAKQDFSVFQILLNYLDTRDREA